MAPHRCWSGGPTSALVSGSTGTERSAVAGSCHLSGARRRFGDRGNSRRKGKTLPSARGR